MCLCVLLRGVGTRPGGLGVGRDGADGGRRVGDASGPVIQNEKSQRETTMGTSCGRKRKRSRIYWALTLGNSPFGCFSQVVSLRGRHYHHIMKAETKAAGREVTQPRSQS